MGRQPSIESALFKETWIVDVGRLRFDIARPEELEMATTDWPAKRPPHHANIHWRWNQIGGASAEAFALRRADSHENVALVASMKTKVQADKKVFYRADYLEVSPAHRGSEVADLCIGLMASRALELGRDGILFTSLPETAGIYEAVGFSRKIPKRWHVSAPLVGFVGWAELLEELRQETYERRERQDPPGP